MEQHSDADELCDFLSNQQQLVWDIFHDATETLGATHPNADLMNFVFSNALHVREMAKAALVLMKSGEPYGVPLLARSALESVFCVFAAVQDRPFGPQRIAFEFEELARKLRLLVDKDMWPRTRPPTPDECLQNAERIRRHYSSPLPARKGGKDHISKIELIAKTAGLSELYDDDYRQLSLVVHSNQAGIMNAASGFLVRVGMMSLCTSAYLASDLLAGVFHVSGYDAELSKQQARLQAVIQRPDYLPGRPGLVWD